MKKFNSLLARFMLVLLALHGLMGAFTLLRMTTFNWKPLSYTLLAALLLHGILGILLSKDAVREGMRTGRWYLKENASFWLIRLSGFVILLSVWFHITAYTTTVNGVFFLREFTTLRFFSQIIFISAILIHLLCATKPWMIKRGLLKYEERTADYILVYSIFSVLFLFALISYFIYWNFRGLYGQSCHHRLRRSRFIRRHPSG